MRKCSCGELVEDHVRFHWTDDGGHYVEEERLELAPETEEVELDPSWTVNVRRASSFFGKPPWRAPAPGPRPPAPWGREDLLRAGCVDYLKTIGFSVYDLEQGYRSDGSTRVGEGIGDAYFHGHGIRGWIEFKRWDNEPSDKQRTFGNDELAAGGIYLVIYELGQLVEWNHRRSGT